jgi:hypothetical protein
MGFLLNGNIFRSNDFGAGKKYLISWFKRKLSNVEMEI